MNLLIFGASGHIGGQILDESLRRGHRVVAVVRDPARLQARHANLDIVVGDIAEPATYRAALHGVDAVIASVSARRNGTPASFAINAAILLDTLPAAAIKQLVWIGGAGSLQVAPGISLTDDPNFPAAVKPEALAQTEALAVFRASTAAIDWTYISPAALIEDGARTGTFRIGGDQLMRDGNGKSHISVADFTIAVLDRVEQNDRPRQRISVAY